MLRRTLKASLIAVFVAPFLFIPATVPQPLDASKPNSKAPTGPSVGTLLPPAHLNTDLNAETLKAQVVGLVNSLTDEQRAQMRAVLDTNAPSTEGVVDMQKDATAATAAPPSREELQALDRAEQKRTAEINAGIRAALTPEQAAIFDATLPPPPTQAMAQSGQQLLSDVVEPATLTDCYNAYYYNYYYIYSYYAYYSYIYSYYNYIYYNGFDAIAYELYLLAYRLFNGLAYNAQFYSYYAYYVSRATYAYSAWFYSDYTEKTSYGVYYLAQNLSNVWASNTYSNNTQYFAYYSWYYAYYYANYYAYYCAH